MSNIETFWGDEFNMKFNIKQAFTSSNTNNFFYWNDWFDLYKVPEEMKDLTDLYNKNYNIKEPYRTDTNQILIDFFNRIMNDIKSHEIIFMKESKQIFVIFNCRLKLYTKILVDNKLDNLLLDSVKFHQTKEFYKYVRGKDFKIKNEHINFIIDYLNFEYEDFNVTKLEYLMS